jgi:hypothetical protein
LCSILQYPIFCYGRFEAGTPAIGEAIGFGAAIDYLSNIGMDQIHAYEVTTCIFGGYVYARCFSVMIYFSESLAAEYSSVFHSPDLTVTIDINSSLQEPGNPAMGTVNQAGHFWWNMLQVIIIQYFGSFPVAVMERGYSRSNSQIFTTSHN